MTRSHRLFDISTMPSFAVVLLIALGLLMATGCGDGHPKCIKVSGVVTYRGKPIENAGVTFMPKGAHPASGKTDAAGRFTLTSFVPGDGAAVGDHVVCISKMERDPKDKTNSPYPKMISVLPSKYAALQGSPLKATVTASGPNDFRFDLTD
jgi:hypothetical protein